MTKIDIFSGFLGAGKTTLIKKLIKEAYAGEKLVLIENEFGEIGIDGGFMQEAGIEVNEMNSGCICCSLVGDFGKALEKVLAEYAPDRILIEPSGVGKLSDVIKAAGDINSDKAVLNAFTTVADAKKCKMYMKNFGEFYNDQIEHASSIILSHTDTLSDDKIEKALELIKEHNSSAVIVTTPWNKISGAEILSAMERENSLENELKKLEHESHEHHHEHGEHCGCHEHHHEHGENCGCHEHHHEHGENCGCHEHHHEHGENCGCHEHHHEHGENCGCHEHHHHHADEVFTSWGKETAKKFTKEQIENALMSFENFDKYGTILRAKGIVEGENGEWIHFDYVPGEADVRSGAASVIGRICVIGSKINEEEISKIFE